MKTVLFCSPTATPIGGVETWLDVLCRSLSDAGWHPRIALLRGLKTHNPDAWRKAHPTLDTVEIDGCGMNADGRIRAVERCLRDVKPTIFIPINAVDACDAVCRAKVGGDAVRFLMTVVGNHPAQMADARRYRNFVDLLVCPGELTARVAVRWAGFDADRVRHVPNGAWNARRNRVARDAHEPLRMAYVGRVSQDDKRVLDVIAITQRLDARHVPWTLQIAGTGPDEDRLKDGLSEATRAGRVRFRGALTATELYDTVYPEVECLLLMSPRESFGICLVEGMMNGVVPVSSRFLGQAAEGIVRHEENALLFAVGDAEGAADQLARLATESSLQDRLSSAARRTAETRYTWEQSVNGWISALEAASAMPPTVGDVLPPYPAGPPGSLDRLGLPDGVVDTVRRTRRLMFGTDPGMAGGEEWPYTRRDYPAMVLQEIATAQQQMDTAEPRNGAVE